MFELDARGVSGVELRMRLFFAAFLGDCLGDWELARGIATGQVILNCFCEDALSCGVVSRFFSGGYQMRRVQLRKRDSHNRVRVRVCVFESSVSDESEKLLRCKVEYAAGRRGEHQ